MNIYDKSNLKYVHNLEKPIIVDLGANIGIESMKLFDLYPNSKIILVEPQSENCDEINTYIKNHNLQDHWTVANCAVDITSGFKEFGFHPFGFTGDDRLNGSLDPFNWKNWNYPGTKLVETKLFNDICSNPNIIKIDIERHEYVVLPEICKNSNIEIMYVELHGPCYDLNIINFLNSCLSENNLEVTSWWLVDQKQTYGQEVDDISSKVDPQTNISCGANFDVIIEKITNLK